jgi:hypothetical protein
LRAGVTEGKADAFLWERFMTEPFVQSGELKRVGELPTPWPCFVLATTRTFLAKPEHVQALQGMQKAITEAVSAFHSLRDAPARLSAKYGLAEVLTLTAHPDYT